jgi:DNA-binding transcriptional regulator/RsmH inhibitor MraZ
MSETAPTKMVYVGRETRAVDGQRRLAIPKEWKGSGLLYVIPGPPGSILAVPPEIFDKLVFNDAESLHLSDATQLQLLAGIGGMSKKCVCDGQGKITLSEELMELAGLTVGGTALMEGAVTCIRIAAAPKEEAPLRQRAEACRANLRQLKSASRVKSG